MAKVDYNSIIRNKIRDFIGSKKWSVSRFASRYVEAFIEIYSRQEAPSTSTSRKLVEEDGHVYTEREVTVLDSFTNMDFYRTWLDGQKAALIERTNRYLGVGNSENSIDSPAMLSATLEKLNAKKAETTLDDVDEVIRRFESLDGDRLLVLYSYSQLLTRTVVESITPRISVYKIEVDTAIDTIKSLVKEASRGEKIVGWIVTDQVRLFERITEVYGNNLFIMRLQWSHPMVESISRKTQDNSANRDWAINRAKSCLEFRIDMPELYKKMIYRSMEQPWVRLPKFESAGQWMTFLQIFYTRMEPAFKDKELNSELSRLIKNSMPEYWFMPECEPMQILECAIKYKKWKAEKELVISGISDEITADRHAKALHRFDCTDIAAIMLWGNTCDIINSDWHGWECWFEERFQFYLVDWDYYKLIDVVYANKLRPRNRFQKS